MNSTKQPMTLGLTDFSGGWSIESSAFSSLQAIAGRVQHGDRATPQRGRPDRDGILTIEVRGPYSKRGSALTGSWIDITDVITAATQDPSVKGVMLVIDSPGGSVAGAHEVAEALAGLSKTKPTIAFAEDRASGASIWIASQARRFFANSNIAVLGSVGIAMGLFDLSKAAEKDGVKPVLIRTGELKGAGFPGSTVTDTQIAMWQSVLDSSFELMAADIRRARPGITSAQWESIAKGGVFSATRAVELGLIDRVCSLDQALAELRSMVSSPKKEVKAMTTTTFTPASPPAVPSVSALESWDSSIAAAMKSGMSEGNAIRHLTATQPDLHQRFLAEFNSKHGQRRSVASRVAAPSIQGTAKQRWDSAIADLVALGRSQQAAAGEVIRTNPALHREYLAEANRR